METAPAVVWDAMVLFDGEAAIDVLSESGHALEFLKDQFRHCKPILFLGAAAGLLKAAGIPVTLPSGGVDAGLLRYRAEETQAALTSFIDAVSKHRHFERETDPPRI